MSRFTVFDVETPNMRNNRMSSTGITVIEDGEITDEYSSLVNPECGFDTFNIELTGITPSMVSDAPTFPELWEEIEPYFSGTMIVAHNAVFDLGVLGKCLSYYGIEWKPYTRYLCTAKIGRGVLPGMSHKLNDMCRYYGIRLQHHIASSDSRACAEILLRYMEDGVTLRDYIRTYSFSK